DRSADGVPGLDHRDRQPRRADPHQHTRARRCRRVHHLRACGRSGRRAAAVPGPRGDHVRGPERRGGQGPPDPSRHRAGARPRGGLLDADRRGARARRPPLVHMFVGEGSETVIDMAVLPLHINAALYSILGVLFVLRGALQGLGQTAVPMVTGVIELVMRLGTAIVLGAVFGYAGVVWGTPLAWAGAVALLIPAYVRAHRRLAALPDG